MSTWFPLLAVLIWSANTVVSKAAAAALDPAAISFYRWLVAGLVLTPFCLRPLWQQRRALAPWLGAYTVLAALGMVMYQCLAYYAAHSTSATNMGVICALIPLLGLVLGGVAFRQRVAPAAWLGVAVSLAGVLYLLGKGEPASLLRAGVNRGDALMLLGSAAYALYGILLKRWAPPFKPWLGLYVQVLLAIVMLIPVALSADSLRVSGSGWGLIAFAGVAASVLAAYCWMRGVERLGSERTAVFMNLLPLFTALFASATLGEELYAYHWLGGGLILLGVYACQRSAVRPPGVPCSALRSR